MNALDVTARGLAGSALAAQRALGDDGGAALIGTAYGIDLEARLGETVSILEGVDPGTHDAVLARTNDDDHTPGVKALIDQLSANGGGTIEVPKRCRLNFDRLRPRSHVSFRGATAQCGNAPSWEGGLPIFQAIAGAPWIVEADPERIIGASFEGIQFYGWGLNRPGGGIHIPDWFRSGIRSCQFDYFADQAIHVESAKIALVGDVFVSNCLLERVRSGPSGAIQFDIFTDSVLLRGEFTPSIAAGGPTSADLNCAAVAVLGGSNSWLIDVLAEFGDVGFQIEGLYHVVRGCRADLNRGHGFRIGAKNSQILGNKGFRNGQGADAIYSDFRIEAGPGYGISNTISGNLGESYASDPNRVAHVVHDTSSTASYPNIYTDNAGHAQRGPTYNLAPGGGGASVQSGVFKLLTPNDPAPSVDNYDRWYFNQGSPLTVTALRDGVDGQIVTIVSNNSQVSIQHSPALVNQSAATRNLIPGKPYQYVRRAGIWYEMPHNWGTTSGGQDTVGDSDKTLVAGHRTMQRWVITLTAERTASLSAAGASRGDRFHIVRSAGGGFDLNVRNDDWVTLKTMASGTWAMFEFDGANWFVAAAGTL